MTGVLYVKNSVGEVFTQEYARSMANEELKWPPKFCKLALDLSDDTKVAFSDSRRFARVRLQVSFFECCFDAVWCLTFITP